MSAFEYHTSALAACTQGVHRGPHMLPKIGTGGRTIPPHRVSGGRTCINRSAHACKSMCRIIGRAGPVPVNACADKFSDVRSLCSVSQTM